MASDSQHVKHFWVASGPFIESYLLWLPSSKDAGASTALLSFYDADGSLVNEAELTSKAGNPTALEVGQFLGSCKLESGIRHAHLMVRYANPCWWGCRLISGASASMLGEPEIISGERTGFMPVVFSSSRHPLLCVVNHSQEEARLRCQLFFGARIPETELLISPMGVRLLALDVEFETSLPKDSAKTLRAYLRFGMHGGGVVGTQVFELYPGSKKEEFISAVG